MTCAQWNSLAREVSSRVSEFRHTAKFRLREYGSVVTDKVGADYAGGAYSNATFEHPFQAYLDVATCFHCEVVDFLHHRLGAASVDRVKATDPENGLRDLADLGLLSVCSVVRCENAF